MAGEHGIVGGGANRSAAERICRQMESGKAVNVKDDTGAHYRGTEREAP